MGRFWVGSDEGYDHAADARYGKGRVWIGSDEGYDHSADARYGNGRIWIGSDEGYDHAADARYGNGRIWNGSDEGYDHAADARYGDGRAWIGSDEGYDHAADGRYDAEGGGAAAATFLVLLGGQETALAGGSFSSASESDSSSDDSVGSSDGSPTESYSGSASSGGGGGYASSPSGSGGLGVVGTVILIVIGAAIWSDSRKPPAPVAPEPNSVQIVGDGSAGAIVSEIGSLLGKETPRQIIDRGACPYEGCRYGERWMARTNVEAYAAPPQMAGATSSLQTVAHLPTGSWVTTQTGLVLSRRHEGRVDNHTTYANGVVNGPRLTPGQVLAIYSYLGEGCYTSWIDGRSYVVCGLETQSNEVTQEWWVQVMTAGSVKAWILSATGSFVSEEGLNTELGRAIEDASMPLAEKLAQVDLLTGEGASLNGDGGRYGTSPMEAAIRTKDVTLLGMLVSRGLDLRRPCPAYVASQIALDPGGDALLEALLEKGMQLECLSEPPLHAFLRPGIALDSYPVDIAINLARVLVKRGAGVNRKDSQGKSILDVLGDSQWAARVSALTQALVEMGASRN